MVDAASDGGNGASSASGSASVSGDGFGASGLCLWKLSVSDDRTPGRERLSDEQLQRILRLTLTVGIETLDEIVAMERAHSIQVELGPQKELKLPLKVNLRFIW